MLLLSLIGAGAIVAASASSPLPMPPEAGFFSNCRMLSQVPVPETVTNLRAFDVDNVLQIVRAVLS